MDRREFNRRLGALAALPALDASGALARERRRWSITADLAECCSCDIPCSCNFGRPERVCHGTRLYEIREGHFEGADLAGINFVVTFDRTRWTRIYIDDGLSDARFASVERLLPMAFAGFAQLARATLRVPLEIERRPDRFRFSVPESTVEATLLPGLDGSPIRVTGLPSSAYHDYVQYESVVHDHESEDGRWSHSGSNGFVSRVLASG